MSIDAKIGELGLKLPAPFPPAGTYVKAVRAGNLLVLGGHIQLGQTTTSPWASSAPVCTSTRAATRLRRGAQVR